jgi:Tfp pilus assembly PilM family ATPase
VILPAGMVSLNLNSVKALGTKLKRRPVDVVGLDIAASGVKAVRLKKSGDNISLVAAEILAVTELPQSPEGPEIVVSPLTLSEELVARYASLAVSGKHAIVKLLAFPGQGGRDEGAIEAKITETVGEEQAQHYRIGYRAIEEGRAKAETRVLLVAVPDVQATAACQLLPAGVPAPHSVEDSGLAAMTAFLHGPGGDYDDGAVGLIEFGVSVSYFVIFLKGVPLLLRKFDFGSDLILGKVQESLGVDRTTAEGILADGSFDISQQISDVMDGFVKQVIVSRDFIERRENCHVTKVFASGGVVASRDWLMEMKSAVGFDLDLWNPFQAIGEDAPEAVPAHFKGQEARFTAAIGAALATIRGDET